MTTGKDQQVNIILHPHNAMGPGFVTPLGLAFLSH